MLGIDYSDVQPGCGDGARRGLEGPIPARRRPGWRAGRPRAVLASHGPARSASSSTPPARPRWCPARSRPSRSWSTWSRSISGSACEPDPRLAAAGPRGRRGDHRRRPDALPAARRRRPAARRRTHALRRRRRPRPRGWPAAADRARPPHALPPRSGLLPGRLDRRRARPRSRRPCARRRRRPGLDPAGVEVFGELPELWLPPSNFAVTPVLGWWRAQTPVTVVDPDEVHAIHLVPITELLGSDHRIERTTPLGLGRAGVPHRSRPRRHPVGLHRGHREPALRLPRVVHSVGELRDSRSAPLHAAR